MDFMRSLKSKIVASTHADLKDREKREDYFAFQKTVQHGFPTQSSCICFDRALNAFAIGTRAGYVKVYGKPGVEFSAQYRAPISRLTFAPGKKRLISLSEDQSFCLWQIQDYSDSHDAALLPVQECNASTKLKRISCWCMDEVGNDRMMIGTESGNIYALDLDELTLIDYLIYQDVVIHNVPDDYKVSPGAVEALAINASGSSKLLVGYNRGLIIVWDMANSCALNALAEGFRVESLCWCAAAPPSSVGSSSGHPPCSFLSAHNDGSYVTHSIADQMVDRMEYKPFGPFPLKPVVKILHAYLKSGEEMVIFTGGMPRSSFGDKFVLTVEQSPFQSSRSKRICFDFSSKIIDFVLVDCLSGTDNAYWPEGILVLCEEELVAIDIVEPDWPTWQLPYCHSFHCSPLTTSCYVSNVHPDLVRALCGKSISKRPWPIQGGSVSQPQAAEPDILVTGHEDGMVKIWSGRTPSMDLLFQLNSSLLFQEHVEPPSEVDEEDNWPPFRKVGSYDPYTDDARFAVQRLTVEPASGLLLCGGSAGQAILYDLANNLPTTSAAEIDVVDVNLTEKSESSFAWKGREKLNLRKRTERPASARCVVQLTPPAALTALTLKAEWRLMAVGTAQGFALVDFDKGHVLFARCLLTAADIENGVATTEGTVARLKSLKKSLRESFRRKKTVDKTRSLALNKATPQGHDDVVVRSVERQIEARAELSSSINSLVRCLQLRSAVLSHGSAACPTFWIATNGGEVFIYQVTGAADNVLATCQLAKHIKLRHAAPILAMHLVDSRGFDLDKRPTAVASCTPDLAARLVIVSEEQLKAFHWPKLVPSRLKNKITATEGCRIRKVRLINFQNRHDESKWEPFLVAMTNQGDLECFSSHNLRRYAHEPGCVPGGASEAICGVLSTLLTERAEGFFMLSSSEWQRFCLHSAHAQLGVKPRCALGAAIDESDNPQVHVQNGPNAPGSATIDDPTTVNSTLDLNETRNLSNNTTIDSVTDYMPSGCPEETPLRTTPIALSS